jgi:hypothetical protein
MAPSYETPFDDLEPFTVLHPEEVGRRLGVTARSVLRAIARGELKASRACGLRVLAADAAHDHLRRPPLRASSPSAWSACRCRRGEAGPDGAQDDPAGIEIRRVKRRDGSVRETFGVRNPPLLEELGHRLPAALLLTQLVGPPPLRASMLGLEVDRVLQRVKRGRSTGPAFRNDV